MIQGRYYRLIGPPPKDIDDVDADGGRIYRQEAATDPSALNSDQLFLYQPYGCTIWVFNTELDLLLDRSDSN